MRTRARGALQQRQHKKSDTILGLPEIRTHQNGPHSYPFRNERTRLLPFGTLALEIPPLAYGIIPANLERHSM